MALEIAVDRGFDIASLAWKGVNIGWNGPNRLPFPPAATTEDGGRGMMRNFDGFLVTCGLDHFGVPATGSAEHFIYPHRGEAHYPFHGRIALQQATLGGYGLDAGGDEPLLWCEAVIRQTALFGEVLALRRRVEVPLFGQTVRLRDRVANEGFRPARHAVLYHFNFGYPLLDASARLFGDCADAARTAFAGHPPVPNDDEAEIVDDVGLAPGRDGKCLVGLRNDVLGVSAAIRFDPVQLPELMMWRAYQSGIFAVGIEPHTHVGDPARPAADFLLPGQSRSYDVEVVVSQ